MGRSLHPPPHTPAALPAPHPAALSRLLYPDHRDVRARLFDLLKEDVFRPRYNETVRMERERTMARIARLRAAGFLRDTVSAGDERGARRYDAVIDVVALLDHSLEVKLGVNFGLFAATVRRLGSPAQYQYWLPRIERGDDSGCFALTELGHGSNVRGIETEAVYVREAEQFDIHTPTESAQKYWIGGVSDTANVAVVFAQLSVQGVSRGIHVFVVPLRDADGALLPGVQVADCGPKAGLNGVDNARIWFSHVRVPRANLLPAAGVVAADGTYTSRFASPDARFGAQLAALTGGRVGIAMTSVAVAMLGLTIAIRYSAVRRAFAPRNGAAEVPLLFYTSQRRRLMMPLATAFVYAFCARDLREDFYASIQSGVVPKNVHSLSAGYKALFTWFMQDALQAAREACGGQGYKSDNRIAPIKADRDVMLTFEGANGVMMQQVAKSLLAEVNAANKNGGKFSTAKGSPVAALNFPPQTDGSSNMLDDDFISATLWRRESKLARLLGLQYAAMLRKHKGSAFHAWNDCLGVAETAALAHMHRRIYTAHKEHLARAYKEETGCGDALKLCGRLWAADVISSNTAFLRFECITPKQAADVEAQIDDLCGQMTNISEQLLEGIDFPDHLLAPIAVDYVEHNSRARL